MATIIHCPYCGKLTDPKLENCPHCGGFLQRQPPRAPGVRPAGRSTAQVCPNCHALVQDGDIVCVACGTNLLTGQKIVEEQAAAAAPSRARPAWLIGGVVVLVLVVIGLAYAGVALMRDPVQQAVKAAATGDYLQGSNLLSQYLERRPNDARAHFELGKMQWRMNQFGAAAASFREAFERDPRNREAGLLAVAGLASSGATARTEQIAVLRRLAETYPEDPEVLYLLALNLGAEGQVAEQVALLRKVTELGDTKPGTRMGLAIALGLQGDYPAAEQALAGAGALAPDEPDIAAARGFLASLEGNLDAARDQLSAAVQGAASVQREATTRLGIILVGQGRFQEAEPYLAKASADRGNTTAMFYHAVCLNALGNLPQARAEFDEVARQAGPLAVQATIRAADLRIAEGRLQEALDALNKLNAAGQAPSAALFVVRARAAMHSGEDDKARDALKRALELDAQYAPAHLENGLLLIKQQFFAEGLKELEQYLALIGPDGGPDARAEEIQALVVQLRQAAGQERPGETAAVPAAGRTSS